MTQLMLRPDFKTAGGEINDILWGSRYAGTITLVYREGDRVSGSIQLEENTLLPHEKNEALDQLQAYVQSLGAAECDVVVTHSPYERIIAEKNEYGTIALGESSYVDAAEDFDYESDWIDNDFRFEDPDLSEQDELSMDDMDELSRDEVGLDEDGWEQELEPYAAGPYELVPTVEKRNRIEYDIYDEEQELVAEVHIRISGCDVTGEVTWMYPPEDDEIEHAAELIVADFNEDEIETFVIDMKVGQDIIETIELTREDLLEDADEGVRVYNADGDYLYTDQDEAYTVDLVRDDGDMLTYDIYKQSRGGLPIGTATVDISQRQLTGFIDFRDPGDEADRDDIVKLLTRELDKEKDFNEINLTMLHLNHPIEELYIEMQPVH
jgi:hypothetical protein